MVTNQIMAGGWILDYKPSTPVPKPVLSAGCRLFQAHSIHSKSFALRVLSSLGRPSAGRVETNLGGRQLFTLIEGLPNTFSTSLADWVTHPGTHCQKLCAFCHRHRARAF